MGVPLGGLETDSQPPMVIPLRHFLVALGFLLLGGLAGLAHVGGAPAPRVGLVHVHLLLAGWVCVTIMGAMTQFVPVWSGARLHSRRLATVELWLVSAGLVGFAGSLLAGRLAAVPAFGAAMVLGFWVFAYNVGRTLATLESLDVTEAHFALALAFFVALTALGLLLAVDLTVPVLSRLPVDRADVVGAHATLAVFGAVLTTVLGALYQLGTMFTQTELHGVDHLLRRVETAGYPLGVVLLAAGRLTASPTVATAGGLLLLAGVLAFATVLARRLHETRVPWTPMLSRYAVVAPSMALWALLTVPAWLRAPLAPAARFGAPAATHLLLVGVVGFVVLGTLYHVVPFVVWVHRYSDRLGYEDVPMIDDLYDDHIARVDFACLALGGLLVSAAEWGLLGRAATAAGGVAFLAGAALFVWNLGLVLRRHSPRSLGGILAPGLAAAVGGDRDADRE